MCAIPINLLKTWVRKYVSERFIACKIRLSLPMLPKILPKKCEELIYRTPPMTRPELCLFQLHLIFKWMQLGIKSNLGRAPPHALRSPRSRRGAAAAHQGRDGRVRRTWQLAICDTRAHERLRSPETRKPKPQTGAPRGSSGSAHVWGGARRPWGERRSAGSSCRHARRAGALGGQLPSRWRHSHTGWSESAVRRAVQH
jgi:hypothetical protein